MNKRWMLIVFGTALLIISSAMVAQAQNNRTWVSGLGASGNTATGCQQAAPCRFFADAIPITNTGGEVVALDSAGYGGIVVTSKALTITGAPGAYAYIIVTSGSTGIVVNAPGALVELRNLHVNCLNAVNTTGLQHAAGNLVVRDSVFKQCTTGILNTAKMNLIDSEVSGNTTGISSSGTGAETNPPTSTATAAVWLAGGNITNNGTAFFQTNPGVNFANIFEWITSNTSAAYSTNITNNGTFLSGTGTGCPTSACSGLGLWSSNTNPH